MLQHPDNMLDTVPVAGMTFATVLLRPGQRDRAGHVRQRPLILCGRRCPDAAAQDGLQDWQRVMR